MRINALPEFLEDELAYPVDHEVVLDRVGTTELEAPNSTDTEPVSNIIDSVGQETYDLHTELFDTIIGNVSDDYIGRKFYDDRGGSTTPSEVGTDPQQNGDVSL